MPRLSQRRRRNRNKKRTPAKVSPVDDKIPRSLLNSMGFINYDQYPEEAEIFLSDKYKSITNFLGIDYKTFRVGHLKVRALGKVSIVNEYGYCLYDTFVNPMVEVTNYQTKTSGIQPEDLENAPPLDVVQQKVSKLVSGKTLVGHSLHNDGRVLKFLNERVAIRDTGIYFKKLFKQKNTPSLKYLLKQYWNIDIQSEYHSSIEGAQAAMKLYLRFRKNWEHQFSPIRIPEVADVKEAPNVSPSLPEIRNEVLVRLDCGHERFLWPNQLTQAKCNGRLPMCNFIVTKKLKCGHVESIKCYKKDSYKCLKTRSRKLTCGHIHELPCKISISGFKCPILVTIDFLCGHQKILECHQNSRNIECDVCAAEPSVENEVPTLVSKNVEVQLACGHSLLIPRNRSKNKAKCTTAVTRTFPCGHSKTKECHKIQAYPYESCAKGRMHTLSCGHQQRVPCQKDVSRVKCRTVVTKDLPCGHQRKFQCFQSPHMIECHPCALTQPAESPYSEGHPILNQTYY